MRLNDLKNAAVAVSLGLLVGGLSSECTASLSKLLTEGDPPNSGPSTAPVYNPCGYRAVKVDSNSSKPLGLNPDGSICDMGRIRIP